MAVVGTGSLDIPSIAEAAKDHVEWHVLEMDEVAGDVFDQLSKSYHYMINQGFAINI